jgi:hypothetical protein
MKKSGRPSPADAYGTIPISELIRLVKKPFDGVAW